jgi:DNA-binding response OmpR family regulator
MKKVLAVDDKPNIIMLIKSKLKANGFEVITAYNGATALELAFSEKPDLVLLDIMMPNMDGFEVFQKLKENDSMKDVPVVFLTASGQRSDESRAMEMGAKYFLTKPFSPNHLLEIVNKALNQK